MKSNGQSSTCRSPSALLRCHSPSGDNLQSDVSDDSRNSVASMAMMAVTAVAAVVLWGLLLGHTEANNEELHDRNQKFAEHTSPTKHASHTGNIRALGLPTKTKADTPVTEAEKFESSHGRLPKSVRPENYKLTIKMDTDFNSSGYGGSVDITFGVLEDTEEIVLHASESIDILAYSLGKCRSHLRKLRRRANYLHLPLDKPIRKGSPSCVLSLNFRASFGKDSRGFYKVAISEENIQWLTFFEPDGAHHAFPCFDEPALKATFDLTLVRPAGLTTVSNMPILRSRKRATGTLVSLFSQLKRTGSTRTGDTKLVREKHEHVVKIAETLHIMQLLHNSVMQTREHNDEDEKKNWELGDKLAILLGDFFWALAFKEIADIQDTTAIAISEENISGSRSLSLMVPTMPSRASTNLL
ncbi:hypothetical protein ISCGN_018349 [Ixodes scapularis]